MNVEIYGAKELNCVVHSVQDLNVSNGRCCVFHKLSSVYFLFLFLFFALSLESLQKYGKFKKERKNKNNKQQNKNKQTRD